MSNKPDWKDAPEWANWLAQDECGSWGFFAKKPTIFADYCWDIKSSSDPEDKWEPAGYAEEKIDGSGWKESLEQRP